MMYDLPILRIPPMPLAERALYGANGVEPVMVCLPLSVDVPNLKEVLQASQDSKKGDTTTGQPTRDHHDPMASATDSFSHEDVDRWLNNVSSVVTVEQFEFLKFVTSCALYEAQQHHGPSGDDA